MFALPSRVFVGNALTYLGTIMFFKEMFVQFLFLVLLIFSVSCQTDSRGVAPKGIVSIFSSTSEKPDISQIPKVEIRKLLESANEQINLTKTYDPAYVVIPYPNGDIPIEKGDCTDVVIRAFRAAGVDLQKEVHEDMAANFSAYPSKWGLPSPDKNIDHRRVPNLQTFIMRMGKSLPITDKGGEYLPGDVVSWDLDGQGMTHIGIVSNIYSKSTKRYLIIHNIGGGTVSEDRIFDWKITGHFRFF